MSSWPFTEDEFPSYTTPKRYSTHSTRSHTRGHGRHTSINPNGPARLSHSRTFSDIIFHGIFGTVHPRKDYRDELSLPGTVYESSSEALCLGNTSSQRPASETAVDSSSIVTTESSHPFQVVVKNLVTDTARQPSLRRRSCRHVAYCCPRCGTSFITQNRRNGHEGRCGQKVESYASALLQTVARSTMSY